MYIDLTLGKTMCSLSTPDISVVYTRKDDTWTRTVLDKTKCQVRDKNVISVTTFPSRLGGSYLYGDVDAYTQGRILLSDKALKEIFE